MVTKKEDYLSKFRWSRSHDGLDLGGPMLFCVEEILDTLMSDQVGLLQSPIIWSSTAQDSLTI